MGEKESKKPVKVLRAGLISVSVWENTQTDKKTGKPYVSKSFSIQKRYKDSEGEWATSTSFNAHELPKLTLLLNKAFEEAVTKSEKEDED